MVKKKRKEIWDYFVLKKILKIIISLDGLNSTLDTTKQQTNYSSKNTVNLKSNLKKLPKRSVVSVAQFCLTLFDPMDYSLPGCSGILQAGILESVAISYPRGSSQPRDQTYISCVSCIGRQVLYHWATWEAQKHRGIKHEKCKRMVRVLEGTWSSVHI